MALCKVKNSTIVIPDTGFDKIITVKQNPPRVVGAIGICIDQLLCPMKFRTCKLIGHDTLGIKLDNGTYTGALGMLQDEKQDADIYLSPQPNLIIEPWLHQTIVMRTEDLIMGQRIFKSDGNYYDMISNFNLGFKILVPFFMSLIFVFVFCFFLIKMIEKYIKRNQILTNSKIVRLVDYHFNSNYTLTSIGLFFICFQLFLWNFLLFVTNTIKTNKVVVDTSEIITNLDDALKTKRVNCFLEKETFHNMAIGARNSILYRIYEKTKFSNDMNAEREIAGKERCALPRDASVLKMFDSNKIFLTGSQMSTFFLFHMLSEMIKMKVFVIDKNLYQFNSVAYYAVKPHRDKIVELTRKFDKNYLETGTFQKTMRCMQLNLDVRIQGKIEIFNSIQAYLSDSLDFADLEYDNFATIFNGYYLILSILFICFLLNHFLIFMKIIYLVIKTKFI